MKKILIILSYLLTLLFFQSNFAKTGSFFDVSAIGNPANINITLCLNGKGPLTCQSYHVSAVNLNIKTTLPNRTYPYAGIKINTPGYSIANLGVDCTPIANGYCLFSVNNTTPKTISLANTNGYSIGGSISGLTGGDLVLQKGSEVLTVPAVATSFQFATPVDFGGSYAVQLVSSPPGLTCTVGNNIGVYVVANITDVTVVCSLDTFTISGTISGLMGAGLTLQNNSAERLTIPSSATSFTFLTSVAYGGQYDVQVVNSPVGYACTANNNTSTFTVFDVNNVTIICNPSVYTIGGTILGLTVPGLVLQNNGGNLTPISANATGFTFSVPVAFDSNYTVSIQQSPPGLACSVSNGSGNNIMANVTDVQVICNPIQYTISGTVTGAVTNGLVLLNNGGSSLNISPGATTTPFTITSTVPYGGNYNVTVGQNPEAYECVVTNGMGSNVTANVTNVTVVCTVALPYTEAFDGGSTLLSWVVPAGFNSTPNLACLTAGDGTSAIPTCPSGGQGGFNASGTTPDSAGQGFLRLTTATAGAQEGGIVFGSLFDMHQGLTIQFNAYSYGGGTTTADGFSFFLLDGGIPVVFGPPGGALGYGNSYRNSGLGIQNGYVGIGFDEYGNFSAAAATPVPNSVGVRGPTSSNNTLITATSSLTPALFCGATCTSTTPRSTITTVNVGFNVYQVSISPAGIMDVSRNNTSVLTGINLNSATGLALPSSVYFGFAASTGPTQNGIKGVTNFLVAPYGGLYSESGTLTGLTGSNSVTLQDNGKDDLILTANGSFTFPSSLLNGSTYNVTVLTQPATQTCTVTNGSGIIASANVTQISVSCS